MLPTRARVALRLRLLGGLTAEEIARAFLVSEPSIAQRIAGAKRTLVWETLMTIAAGVLLGALAASVSLVGVLSVLSSTKPTAHVSLPVPELAFVIGGCLGIALVASLLPAKLALRAGPLDNATNRE